MTDATITEIRTCSRCGHRGPLGRDFGMRTSHGKPYPESLCRPCKAEKSAQWRKDFRAKMDARKLARELAAEEEKFWRDWEEE